VVDREERRVVTDTPISFPITVNTQILQNMKKLIIIIIIGITAASCGTSKQCHTKGYYVSKSIKKAQQKPRQ
jgi:hypothetical protein